MADTVQALLDTLLSAEVTFDLSQELLSANPSAPLRVSGSRRTLNATSTVPATKAWGDQRQLSGGADTLDLTALARSPLTAVDFTGLKVQAVKLVAAAANTSAVVFVDGATNGYTLFGDGSGQVSLLPGAEALFYWNDKLPDVAAGAKSVDVSSVDSDAVYDIILVAG